MITAIVLLILAIALYSIPKFGQTQKILAIDGHISFDSLEGSDDGLYLNGYWEFYPDVFFTEYPQDSAVFSNPDFMYLPTGNLNKASLPAAYRLTISTQNIGSAPVLLIPHLCDQLDLFVNGVKQEPVEKRTNYHSLLRPFQYIFPITAFDSSRETQEIVIIANAQKNSAALYKRPLVLTTFNNAVALSYLKTINAFLIFGLIIFITLNGFIFMILMPQHRIISLITLFDMAIVCRILFGSPEIISLFKSILPVHLSDSFLLSGQILSFMMGGCFGSILAHYLLDAENRVPRYLSLPIPIVYLILALVLPFNLKIFYNIGLPLFITIYIYTFIIVFFQFIVYWKRNRNFYAAFQIAKTSYIGIILFVDIILLPTYTNFLLFEYLFLFFFLAHVITKLYDNNNSYKEVYLLNKNLEKTVVERTLELSHKNKVLSELSIRDPLTSIYNRLYFDEYIEAAIRAPQAGNMLYLCMFDLDHFKAINDTYGHDVGDEELKSATETVLALIPQNTIFARVGGEEFMLLYSSSTAAEVVQNVETIRAAFDTQAKENQHRTTASFAVVKYTPPCTKKEFLKMADRNLYQAKETGRNKVVYDLSGTAD